MQDEPVDAARIAQRLGHSRQYVAASLTKVHGFPEPQGYELNGGRWWWWSSVVEWVNATGRTKAG